MRDTDFLSELLRVDLPSKVTEAALDREHGRVDARIEWQGPGKCPTCGLECPKHDHRERTWRDLDLCADQLYLDAAKTIKRHFANILTYLKIPITNAGAEGLNSKIQMIKYRACGYRNEDRFERAILFHCSGLDLSPAHHKS